MGLKSSAAKPKAGSLLASDKARSPKARLGKMRGVLTRWKHKLDRSDSNRLKMPLRRSSRASLRSLESTRNSSQTLLGRLPGARSSSFSFSSRSTTLPVRALRPIEEEYTIPEFDQETDLKVIVDDLPLQADLDLALERLIPSLEYKDPGKACPSKDRDCPYGYCPCEPYPTQKIDLSSPMFPWFKLPLKIKQRIYELCFPHEDRRISLMRPSLTEAAFPADYFASPWDVLDPVWGLLECCYAWRTEVLAYFWSQFHFHVTLNEFTGPLTCQLSHVWLVENLSMVQRLTIERDYTRLAGSAKKNADQLSFKVAAKVRATVQTYVKELLKRADGMHMAELHVMARGYVGCRPGTESRYVPEAIEDNVAPILELSKILKRCRMSGFSRTFSNSVLQSLFEDRIGRVVPSVPFDNAWPSLMACTLEGLYTPSIMSTSELEQGVKWSIKTKEILKKKFIKKSSKAEKNGAKGSDKNAETRLFTPPAPTSIPQLGSTFAHIEVLPQNSITKNGRSPTVAHDPGAAISMPNPTIRSPPSEPHKIFGTKHVLPSTGTHSARPTQVMNATESEKNAKASRVRMVSEIIGDVRPLLKHTDDLVIGSSEHYTTSLATVGNAKEGGPSKTKSPDISIPRSMKKDNTSVDESSDLPERFPDFASLKIDEVTKEDEAKTAINEPKPAAAEEAITEPVFDLALHQKNIAMMNEANEQNAAYQLAIEGLKRRSDPAAGSPNEESHSKGSTTMTDGGSSSSSTGRKTFLLPNFGGFAFAGRKSGK